MKKSIIRFPIGEPITGLTILKHITEPYKNTFKRLYKVKHTHKVDPDQDNEPCLAESIINHQSMKERITLGRGLYCQKCRNTYRGGRKKQLSGKTKDSAVISEQWKPMKQLAQAKKENGNLIPLKRRMRVWCDRGALRFPV